MMTEPLLKDLCADARFYRQLKHPGKPVNRLGTVVTALGSRGWWLLAFHRITFIATSRRDLRSPRWWLMRLLEIPSAYLSAVLGKSELLGDCEVESPVYLSDKGYLMFSPRGVGAGSVIHHQITAGYAVAEGKSDRPTIGKNVWIGPNCIIAGKLHVGDGATLLPNTVLTYSVPPGSVVRGNPARIIRKDFDNTALRQSLKIVEALPDT